MEQKIRDKRMLITGASKGLGKAVAIAFEQYTLACTRAALSVGTRDL